MDSKQGPLEISTPIRNANMKSSTRKWKNKLKEWGYEKNIKTYDMQCIVAKGTKREREGKDTIFFHGDTQITATRIENFKKRKTREVPPSVGELSIRDAFQSSSNDQTKQHLPISHTTPLGSTAKELLQR